MTMHPVKTIAHAILYVLSVLLIAAGSAHGDQLDSVLQVSQAKTAAAKESQAKIDNLADQTRDLLQEYKTVNKEIDGLRVYNARLEKQIENQAKRIREIEESISQVTVIQRQITPLLIRMIDGLEQFVELDVPFHMDERRKRIEFLRDNLDRADVSVAEKFRQVLEAYKIENEYGRKIDAYKDTINIDGIDREVNVFRVGRVALLYQTTDGDISGVWNQQDSQWQQLDSSEYRNAIQRGLRIARKQAAIDILDLPIPAPEAVQ